MGKHLTPEQARRIREEYSNARGEPRFGQRRRKLVGEFVRQYGVSRLTILKLLAGKTFPDPNWSPRGVKLTAREAREVRAAHDARPGKGRYESYPGAFVEQLAERYEVSPRVIRKVLKGQTF